GGDDGAAQPVDVGGGAGQRHPLEHLVGQAHPGQALAGGGDAPAVGGVGGGPGLPERGRVGLVGQPPPDHLDALGDVAVAAHLDGDAEAVEQLRPQLALLRVHRADQQEAGGVADADALALDVVDAQGGGVQQQVDEVVAEEVDLVDVEDAAVGGGQQAGLEGAPALDQGALQVQRPGDPVGARPDRQPAP